jgi:uridine kinase
MKGDILIIEKHHIDASRKIVARILPDVSQTDRYIITISNDLKRREDDAWLGPDVEVEMDLLNQQIRDALQGANKLTKPLVDYAKDTIAQEIVPLDGVRVVIIEGTYTALLRHVNCRVFIARNRLDTLEHRNKRSRGTEAGDPFIEDILKTEHKIIAGFRYLADIIIMKDYDVMFPDDSIH